MKKFFLFGFLFSICMLVTFEPILASVDDSQLEKIQTQTMTIFVGPDLVDCVGVGPQKCMMIKETNESQWKYFFDTIQGFTHELGYEYQIQVLVTDVVNPPADASSKNYELVKIQSKTPVSVADQTLKNNHHVPFMGICAPGFAVLGEICVLNDRCGPGAYPGKLCIMDNKVQPYLKPLKQGNSGIVTSDVICAENLQLIFKHDASPACVKINSVEKLESRGWFLEKPPVACTKEYLPLCGMNNITYGNTCMLNAEHMGIKHQGECQDLDTTIVCAFDWTPVCGVDGITYGNMCMLTGAGMELNYEGECNELTEFDLDQKYQVIQNDMGIVSGDIFNGMYNGNLPLDDALFILESSKQELSKIKQNYDTLDEESKTDKQIAMRFSTLGKMGFASIDSQISMIKKQIKELEENDINGVYPSALEYTKTPPTIDSEQGYFVDEIASGIYWLAGSGYQTMFLTTGEGVIVIDAPQPIGEKYLAAIKDVTQEPITHMIYSHSHADHTGAAGNIFSPDITYISHIQAANALAQENDPIRPIPTVTFDDSMHSLTVGNQTLELHYLGNFHSSGDILILAPQQKVAMLVDLMRPGEPPYRGFGVTPDIDLYLDTHDVLQNFDFDVLISGHTNLLATKEDIKINKQFTESVLENAKNALGSDKPVEACVDNTIEQWTGKLKNLDTFMVDHCTRMVEYLQ